MRRKEKEIDDVSEMHEIIKQAGVCRLGLAVNNMPYVVPVNFGYDAEENCLYFHCAKEGRKMDMIKQNNTVCFEMDIDMKIFNVEKTACNWSTSYRSVIGYGEAFILENSDDKKKALDVIMRQYSSAASFEYNLTSIEKVALVKIAVTGMTGKKSS